MANDTGSGSAEGAGSGGRYDQNVVALTGRLSKVPQFYQGEKDPMCISTIAVGRGQNTDFFFIVTYGRQAEILSGYAKGQLVSVSGRLSNREWEGRLITEIKVSSVNQIGARIIAQEGTDAPQRTQQFQGRGQNQPQYANQGARPSGYQQPGNRPQSGQQVATGSTPARPVVQRGQAQVQQPMYNQAYQGSLDQLFDDEEPGNFLPGQAYDDPGYGPTPYEQPGGDPTQSWRS